MLGAGVAAIQPPAIDGFMQRPLSSFGKSLGLSYFLDVPSRGNSGEVGVRERPGISPELYIYDATLGQWVSTQLFLNGTPTAPSITFTSDPDTGLYRAGEGTLGFTSQGSFVFTMNGDGFLAREAGSNPSYSFGTSPTSGFGLAATDVPEIVASGVQVARFASGSGLSIMTLVQTVFTNLGSSASNGSIAYCSDCTFANPCASGGTGAIAKRLNGAWRCD